MVALATSGIVKLVNPADWMDSEPVVERLPFSSRGLRGSDRLWFMKRAGLVFEPDLDRLRQELRPGDYPIHVNALGAYEFVGANRNGDGFPKKACEDYAWTFVKLARWYRNHDSTDPRRSYGLVKAAKYNPDMGRVELIVFLNGTKEAAERNGGRVADRELDILEKRGEDLQSSMACRVPFDICSGCGHKSKKREEYCGPEMCKYGGLAYRIGRSFEDGHTLHAINDHPYWCDISFITPEKRQADRTSYASRADYLMKEATEIHGGAWLADHLNVTTPAEVNYLAQNQILLPTAPDRTMERLKLARELSLIEQTIESGIEKAAAAGLITGEFPVQELPSPNSEAASSAIQALAQVGTLLSPRDFCRWCGVEDAGTQVKMAMQLPGIYSRLLEEGTLFRDRVAPCLDPDSATMTGDQDRYLALKTASEHSLVADAVWRRSVSRSLSGQSSLTPRRSLTKQAAEDSAGSDGSRLARHYAMYKLACLDFLRKRGKLSGVEQSLLLENAVWQNHAA